MPISDEQVRDVQHQIELLAASAAPFVAMLGPQAVAAMVIGRAIAPLLPVTVQMVERLLTGSPITDTERAQNASELAVLNDPALP